MEDKVFCYEHIMKAAILRDMLNSAEVLESTGVNTESIISAIGTEIRKEAHHASEACQEDYEKFLNTLLQMTSKTP